MKRLMIHVERTVRPIRAEESTKCRMREEQHAHIIAIYEEELQRTGDQKRAIELACERFGNPADLRVDLQRTVPWIEHALFVRMDAYLRRRKHETVLRHAMRMAGAVLLSYTILCVVAFATVDVLAAAGMGGAVARASRDFAVRTRLCGAMGLFFVINAGVFTLIGAAMRTQMETGLLRPRSMIATSGLCLLASASVFFTGWGLLWITLLDPGASFALLPRWFVLAGVTPFGFAVVSRLAAMDVARSRPWTSLQLDE